MSKFGHVSSNNQWEITPETIAKVYDSVLASTILRRLCFLGFTISCNVVNERRWNEQNDQYTMWETAFCNCPELGLDYFKHTQTRQADTSSINFGGDKLTISSGGACRFHDHSDIAGWVRKNRTICPYPQGPPVIMPPVEKDGVEEHEKESTEENTVQEDAAVVYATEDAMPMDAAVEDAVVAEPSQPS
jgi:hypothetical protein